MPIEELLRVDALEARTEQYMRHAVALGEAATRSALASAGIDGETAGILISASCTGHMMPSLDARLIDRLHPSPNARRIPLTERGRGSLGGEQLIRLAHARLVP